ncbi:hypothetical protein VI03_25410 [Burkholderia vietnamiensis]|uniref:hypothetical protein n=1 Tax=Burkholderia vietnamiensis TaxID=60552 RepID=UPI0006212919|nr:hypothetical protein [Burkholderia vietnamiensis]KKI36112.1 hypothetical protein VI03_25410 [Burkholderia vietnamiensis]MBR8189114.1 hypothetical protein [Burkholderia vietnamiensis]
MNQASAQFMLLSMKRAIAFGTMGFWSTEHGWTHIDEATRFDVAGRASAAAGLTGAEDERWVLVAGNFSADEEVALAMQSVARAAAQDIRSIGRSPGLDSSVDILVARAAQGDDSVLWDLERQLRQFVGRTRARARCAATRALLRVSQRQLDGDDAIRALGVATITAVGSENVYLVKDAAQFYFKPACNRGYAIGIHDFGAEPEPSSGAAPLADEVRQRRAQNGGLPSSQELADRYQKRGSMPPGKIHALFVVRALETARLGAAHVIRSCDLAGLDRGTRFHVADSLFNRCDDQARAQLCNDMNPHVRSAAAIARLRLGCEAS